MLNASVRKCGAALIALFLVLLPALALADTPAPAHPGVSINSQPSPDHTAPTARGRILLWAMAAVSALAGTVTVTYAFLPNGTTVAVSSTTGPTAAQASLLNSIVAQVNMADADTTATITHNLALTSTDVTLFRPWIQWYIQSPTAGTAVLVFNVSNTNTVVITKTTGTGSGLTAVVILQRPNSIIT